MNACAAAKLRNRIDRLKIVPSTRKVFNGHGCASDQRHRPVDDRRHAAHRKLPMVAHELEQQSGDRHEHRYHPAERADEEARAQRALHGSVPMR